MSHRRSALPSDLALFCAGQVSEDDGETHSDEGGVVNTGDNIEVVTSDL